MIHPKADKHIRCDAISGVRKRANLLEKIASQMRLAQFIWGHIWGHVTNFNLYNVSIIDTYRVNSSLLGHQNSMFSNALHAGLAQFGTKSSLYAVPKLRPTVAGSYKISRLRPILTIIYMPLVATENAQIPPVANAACQYRLSSFATYEACASP